MAAVRAGFDIRVGDTMGLATLQLPADNFAHSGGRTGARHTEHLGHMPTQMQWLQRAYPDATW